MYDKTCNHVDNVWVCTFATNHWITLIRRHAIYTGIMHHMYVVNIARNNIASSKETIKLKKYICFLLPQQM